MEQPRHLWVRGRCRAGRIRLLAELDVPPVLAVVDAHRRLRGPYTAAGTLLRQLVPLALPRWPRLVARHRVAILAAAPELMELIPDPGSGSASGGLLFHLPSRTSRIADGLAEFLSDLRRHQGGGATIMFENAQHADPTDVELIAALLRRVDPTVITVVAGTTMAPVPDRLAAELVPRCAELTTEPDADTDTGQHIGVDVGNGAGGSGGVGAHGGRVNGFTGVNGFGAVGSGPVGSGAAGRRGADPGRGAVSGRAAATVADPAASFVATDGTSDDELLREAYQRTPAARRAQLHDRRAEQLERSGEFSWRLGAVPWHRELGRDPSGAGAAALRFAADHCLRMGFHDAAAELAARGRAVIDRRSRPREWWAFTTKLTTSQAALGRLGRAETEAQRTYAADAGAAARCHLAFADAMLGAGALDDADRHGVLAWIAGAAQLPGQLAASVVELGRQAVVELLRPDPQRAIELVGEAIVGLGAAHSGLRAVLLGNRAHLHARLRRWDDALHDRTTVVGLEPAHADHHHEQGVVLHRLGRHAEAAAAFDRAIALSPPFVQAHRARADTRHELGDHAGALADLRYVLELRPGDAGAMARQAELLAVGAEPAAAVGPGAAVGPAAADVGPAAAGRGAAAGQVGPHRFG